MKELMDECYDIKVRAMLGEEEGDNKEVTILNRTIRWNKGGIIAYEADHKHVETGVKEM